MGVYASAYSVVVRNETVEIVFTGGLDSYARNAPNATFCTAGKLSRIGFMEHDSALTFVEQLIEVGFYASREGGQDIAVVDQARGVTSNTPWASFIHIGETPVCYLSKGRKEPIAYPAHGPHEKLTFLEPGDIPWLQFIKHEDGVDEWEDTRSKKKFYMAIMKADIHPRLRGLRLDFINNRLLELLPEVEKARESGQPVTVVGSMDELEALREEAERLEMTMGAHHAHALYCAGLANRLLERYDHATDYYRACLVTSPDNLSLLLELTLCLGVQGKVEEARTMALRSIEVAPESAEAWGNLASACIGLGLRIDARTALDKAMGIDPENTINLAINREYESCFTSETPAGDSRAS